jgi:hypothetical protein
MKVMHSPNFLSYIILIYHFNSVENQLLNKTTTTLHIFSKRQRVIRKKKLQLDYSSNIFSSHILNFNLKWFSAYLFSAI